MYKRNLCLIYIVFFIAFYSSIKISANNQKSVSIYYQANNSLLKIDLADLSTSQIFSNLDFPVQFSPDSNIVTFQNDYGVWVSSLETLKFRNILTEAIKLPKFSAPFWTPDSQSLIFNYAKPTAQGNIPDQVKSYIYDRKTDRLSTWDWGTCTSIVRNRISHHFALKCSSVPSSALGNSTSIALEWGGAQSTFIDKEYETLLNNINFPSNYDWSLIDNEEQIVYIKNEVPAEIYVATSAKEPESFGLAANYTVIPNIVAVSPDQSKVAYVVECNDYGPKSCLQISEIPTKKIIWDYSNTISLSSVWNLKWSPDNQYIVLLGVNGTTETLISAFDITSGVSIKFPVKNAVGNITVAYD